MGIDLKEMSWLAEGKVVEVRKTGLGGEPEDRFSRGGRSIEEKFLKWGTQLILKRYGNCRAGLD